MTYSIFAHEISTLLFYVLYLTDYEIQQDEIRQNNNYLYNNNNYRFFFK